MLEDQFLKKHIPLFITRNAFKNAINVINKINKNVFNQAHLISKNFLSIAKAAGILKRYKINNSYDEVKKITEEELAEILYTIDVLLVEFEAMSIPEGENDPRDRGRLDQLVDLRNQLLYDRMQMDSLQIRRVFEKAVRLYGDLAQHLSALKDFAPEFFEERKEVFLDRGKPATVIVLENKKSIVKKISAEKIITFCGYLFPKKFREGAKGDIFETRNEMIGNGCSKTAIFWVTFIKITSLILSSLRVQWGDWFDPEKERNK